MWIAFRVATPSDPGAIHGIFTDKVTAILQLEDMIDGLFDYSVLEDDCVNFICKRNNTIVARIVRADPDARLDIQT